MTKHIRFFSFLFFVVNVVKIMMKNSANSNGNSNTFTVHDRVGAAVAPSTNTSTSTASSTSCSINLTVSTNVMPAGNLSSATAASCNIATGTNPNDSTKPISTVPNQHQELVNLFECPVCFDYALPPILQCQSGHIVCSQCRQKLSSCPTCRGPLGNIRNLGMEKVADTILFPCKYQTNGCQLNLMHKHKLEHEDGCDFRPVRLRQKKKLLKIMFFFIII